MLFNSMVTKKDIENYLHFIKADSYENYIFLYDLEKLIIINILTSTVEKTITFFEEIRVYNGFYFEDNQIDFPTYIDLCKVIGNNLIVCTTNGLIYSMDLLEFSINLIFEEKVLVQNKDYSNYIFEQYKIYNLHIFSKVNFIDYFCDDEIEKHHCCIVDYDLETANEKLLYTTNDIIYQYYIKDNILILLLNEVNIDRQKNKDYILILELKKYTILKRVNNYVYDLNDHIYYDSLSRIFFLEHFNQKYKLYKF